MMTLLSLGVFAGTFGVSVYAIAATVAPRMDRIVVALSGQPQAPRPLEKLVRAERHIAVRRWAAQSRPAMQMRAAA